MDIYQLKFLDLLAELDHLKKEEEKSPISLPPSLVGYQIGIAWNRDWSPQHGQHCQKTTSRLQQLWNLQTLRPSDLETLRPGGIETLRTLRPSNHETLRFWDLKSILKCQRYKFVYFHIFHMEGRPAGWLQMKQLKRFVFTEILFTNFKFWIFIGRGADEPAHCLAPTRRNKAWKV